MISLTSLKEISLEIINFYNIIYVTKRNPQGSKAFNTLLFLLLVVILLSDEYDAKVTLSSMLGMLPSVTTSV